MSENPALATLRADAAATELRIRGAASSVPSSAKVSFTRPADTTAYAALDVVGTSTSAGGAVLEFTNMGVAAGDTIITDVDLMIDVATAFTGMANMRLHLFNATPPSALGDNAAFVLAAGDRAAYLGFIDFGTPVSMGSTVFAQPSPQVPKKVRMGASTSLYGYLQTIAGMTPTSGATFTPRLNSLGS